MRFGPRPPWTRSHEKFAKAWGDLQQALARQGSGGSMRSCDWTYRRWGVWNVRDLTPAEARAGCRQLGAWRAAVEGRIREIRAYPRQWERNQARRRRFTAGTTAYARGGEFENLIRGTALEALGGLMPEDSR